LENNVLSALTPHETSLLLPYHSVELRQGEYLHRSGERVEQVVFPRSGVISLIADASDGDAIEVAMIGHEGILGSSAFAGSGYAINSARVQVSGRAYSIPRARFLNAIDKSKRLGEHAARLDSALLAQAQQAAACNATHPAQARICRWLLEIRDRCNSDTVPLTQELLARMVAIQRTTVNLIVGRLQASEIIRCRRGKVYVLNATKLAQAACQCYERMRKLRENLYTGFVPERLSEDRMMCGYLPDAWRPSIPTSHDRTSGPTQSRP
jgi:CRP-like cAMP-binding protein